MIRRGFLHIPDVFTTDGVVDLLSLCNLFEMINTLIYTLSDLDRHRLIEARRLCRRMIFWLQAFLRLGNSPLVVVEKEFGARP